MGLMVSILILFARPGQSRENDSRRCARFKPVEPNSLSEQRGEAPDAKVIKVTSAATKKKPITIEFEHGPGFWIPDEVPVIEDSAFFNVQVFGKDSVLNVRTEWATIGDQSRSDIDLYLFDSSGSQIGVSNTFNPLPPLNESDGGPGFEFISMPATTCEGFTIESRAFWSAGEDMVLDLWLD
ncbi:MAG: hypothetical protein ACRDI3_02665 [Actinomycetota bacterium]